MISRIFNLIGALERLHAPFLALLARHPAPAASRGEATTKERETTPPS